MVAHFTTNNKKSRPIRGPKTRGNLSRRAAAVNSWFVMKRQIAQYLAQEGSCGYENIKSCLDHEEAQKYTLRNKQRQSQSFLVTVVCNPIFFSILQNKILSIHRGNLSRFRVVQKIIWGSQLSQRSFITGGMLVNVGQVHSSHAPTNCRIKFGGCQIEALLCRLGPPP